jgi:hypothetical protein
MSREFGSDMSGYFHTQIQFAADDCESGNDELTRLWGEWFREFYHIAYAIASSEACDSGPDFPIYETIQAMPKLKKIMKCIENYTMPYQDVMRRAVREKLQEIESTDD